MSVCGHSPANRSCDAAIVGSRTCIPAYMATTHVIMFKDGDERFNNSGLENSGSHVNQILTYHLPTSS